MPTQDPQGRYVPDSETSTVAALASAARTSSSNGSSFSTAGIQSLNATLVVSAASGTNETLDVVLQTSADGTNFYDLEPAFPQQTGTTAGVARVIDGLGNTSRWKWTIGGTDTPSFTFAISATAERD